MQKGLKLLTILMTFVVSSDAVGDMGQTSQEADAAINDTAQKAAGREYTANDVFDYAGPSIPEATYDAASMESAKFAAASKSETFNLVKESIDQRQPYEMDVVNDPLIKKSNDLLSTVGKNLQWKEEIQPGEPQKTLHKCRRGQEIYEAKCRRILVPRQTGVRQEEKTHRIDISGLSLYRSNYAHILFGAYNPTDSLRLSTFKTALKDFGQKVDIDPNTIVSVTYSHGHGGTVNYYYQAHKGGHTAVYGDNYQQFIVVTKVEVPVFELIWQESCQDLEALIDQGQCEISSIHCLDNTKIKIVERVSLTADCWEQELTYRCHAQLQNTCTALLEKGCIQVNSTCKTQEGGECIEWEQTFECENNSSLTRSRITGKDIPFCLDGDCVNQSWAPNQDMADSLSKLAMFKEMQKDMDPNTQTVFKGKPLQCSRIPASFKNCCVQKGWGMKVGLASCNAEEKDLAQQRKLNKCIQVGTYCAQKRLGICTKKKTSFCCYQTKLARIINEQGRSQLGLGFGSPQNPQCDALTLAHFTQIDFSKINFSELFQDLLGKVNLPNTTKISQGLQQSMQDQSRIINDRQSHITQGRKHGDF
jgi:type-F conjugative transfer system mating-pair stabilization protein TraN